MDKDEDNTISDCRRKIIFALIVALCSLLTIGVMSLIDTQEPFLLMYPLLLAIGSIGSFVANLHQILKIVFSSNLFYIYFSCLIYTILIPLLLLLTILSIIDRDVHSSFFEIVLSLSPGTLYILKGDFIFDPVFDDFIFYIIFPLVIALWFVRAFLFFPSVDDKYIDLDHHAEIDRRFKLDYVYYVHKRVLDFVACSLVAFSIWGFFEGMGINDGCGRAHHYADYECDPDFVRTVDAVEERYPEAAGNLVGWAIFYSWILFYFKFLLFSAVSAFLIKALAKLGWRLWPVKF